MRFELDGCTALRNILHDHDVESFNNEWAI